MSNNRRYSNSFMTRNGRLPAYYIENTENTLPLTPFEINELLSRNATIYYDDIFIKPNYYQRRYGQSHPVLTNNSNKSRRKNSK
jgi:hypothetical protein